MEFERELGEEWHGGAAAFRPAPGACMPHSPGTNPRMLAPSTVGISTMTTSCCSREVESRETPPAADPSSQGSMSGSVKTARRLEVTVRRMAIATLPPMVCVNASERVRKEGG